jgi:predicted transcriptional regulator
MKDNRSPFDLVNNNQEVAKELGVTEQGANHIKNVALKKARAMLKEKGYKSTDFFGEKDET